MKTSDPSSAFITAVQMRMKELGCDFDTAWEVAKVKDREVYQRLMGTPNPRVIALANADSAEERRAAAEIEFQQIVYKYMRETGRSFAESWESMRLRHRSLHNRAVGLETATPTGNDITGAVGVSGTGL